MGFSEGSMGVVVVIVFVYINLKVIYFFGWIV